MLRLSRAAQCIADWQSRADSTMLAACQPWAALLPAPAALLQLNTASGQGQAAFWKLLCSSTCPGAEQYAADIAFSLHWSAQSCAWQPRMLCAQSLCSPPATSSRVLEVSLNEKAKRLAYPLGPSLSCPLHAVPRRRRPARTFPSSPSAMWQEWTAPKWSSWRWWPASRTRGAMPSSMPRCPAACCCAGRRGRGRPCWVSDTGAKH